MAGKKETPHGWRAVRGWHVDHMRYITTSRIAHFRLKIKGAVEI